MPRAPASKQLLRLQSFDVAAEIGDPLLHFALVATAHAAEQMSPDRHVCRAMRGGSGFATYGRR